LIATIQRFLQNLLESEMAMLIRTQSKVKVTPRLEVLEKESTQALIDWKVGMQYQL